jgi:AcrR family transcriptional regulator
MTSVVRRPGGRGARVRAAVLSAATTLLAAGDEPSVERIAELAGVNKTSIYRRWGDLAGVLGDLLLSYGERVVPIPDTGDLERDLRELALLVARGITGAPGGVLMRRLVTAAPDNPRAAEVVRAFVADRFGRAAAVIERAEARGDVPPGTDARAVIELLGAPFYLRLLVTGDPIDEEFALRVAAAGAAVARSEWISPVPHPNPPRPG